MILYHMSVGENFGYIAVCGQRNDWSLDSTKEDAVKEVPETVDHIVTDLHNFKFVVNSPWYQDNNHTPVFVCPACRAILPVVILGE